MLDGGALCVLERLVRSRQVIAEQPGIDRPVRMNVCLAEIGITVGISLLSKPRKWRAQRSHHGDADARQ
jgi:hypothetical protein